MVQWLLQCHFRGISGERWKIFRSESSIPTYTLQHSHANAFGIDPRRIAHRQADTVCTYIYIYIYTLRSLHIYGTRVRDEPSALASLIKTVVSLSRIVRQCATRPWTAAAVEITVAIGNCRAKTARDSIRPIGRCVVLTLSLARRWYTHYTYGVWWREFCSSEIH